MAAKKIIAICQSGGDFVTDKDGSLSYSGGEAFAIDINEQTSLSDFKSEIADMFSISSDNMSIKYFLPGNKKTLITISKDKDLQRMLSFLGDSLTVDVFVASDEAAARNVSNMRSRSSRTTVSEAVGVPIVAPANAALGMTDAIDDVDMYMPNETPIDCMPINIIEHHKAAQVWENTISGVDQRFNSFNEFREALHKYSIAHGFAYRYKKNDSHRVTVKCKAQGCPWRIYASRLSTTQLICIKKMNTMHTCGGAAVKAGQLTFVADFQNGLKQALADVFDKCYHSYCLQHLADKLNRELKGHLSHDARRFMISDFYSAARSPRLEGFQRDTELIRAISPEAYDWIIQSEPEHWANAFFGGARYNHLISTFGQQFYSWVSEAHEFPITQMIDELRGKMMEAIYKRRVDSSQWMTKLTPCNEEKLQKETAMARSFQVLLTQGSTFEVRGENPEVLAVVNIDHWDCSCKGWQLTGLPCSHAIAVIECIGRSPYDYCSQYFTTESFRLTYAESIHPVPNVDRPIEDELPEVTAVAVTVTPPPSKRPPGRPKKKQPESIDMMRRQLQCSKCKGLGHNKKTCKES
ncbi:hypothetical protein GOBAR_DD24231 [Gossypium barbadense]|nr:hypothetical protein GOBAR_DD24231 [Gossypium barbadense]